MFNFFATENFDKSLKKLDSSAQETIKKRLKFLAMSDNPLFFAKKIKGYKDIFRFRSGDYRILFRLEKEKIILLLTDHRKNVYKGL